MNTSIATQRSVMKIQQLILGPTVVSLLLLLALVGLRAAGYHDIIARSLLACVMFFLWGCIGLAIMIRREIPWLSMLPAWVAVVQGTILMVIGWGVGLPVYVSATWTSAEFKNTTAAVAGGGDAVYAGGRDGNEIPYVPEWKLAAGVSVTGEKWAVNLDMTYAGTSWGTGWNGTPRVDIVGTPANEGVATIRDGKIDSLLLFDLSGHYQVTENVKLLAGVEGHFSVAAFAKPFAVLTESSGKSTEKDKLAAREDALRTMRQYRTDLLNHPVLVKLTDKKNPFDGPKMVAAAGYLRAALKRIEIETLIGV